MQRSREPGAHLLEEAPQVKPTQSDKISMSRVDGWLEAKAETITVDNPVKVGGYTRSILALNQINK